MTEQFGFHEGLGDGGTVDHDKGFLCPRSLEVNVPGDKFLARAGFALDENRTRYRHRAPGPFIDVVHDRALADYISQGNRLIHQFGQQLILKAQGVTFAGAIHDQQQFFLVKRFFKIIRRAFFDGGYRCFYRGVCRHDDHVDFRGYAGGFTH
ncbi:MAG: hypothetical protein BWX80_04228 [Candidatus Hydrogenedentes bacterium ADurb.Bin101]|nr:MAG: hypothetical protein BWX80_04228 [Candidatus Hydrogenedentes bacterium ADurb.Bin101]